MRLHDGAAQQAAQHVAAPFIARQDTIGDHERDRATVIGHDAQAKVHRVVFAVGDPCQALAHRYQTAQHVGLVVGLHALQDGGDALEAHAGVDVFLGQFGKRAVLLTVELGEHAIPVFQEAVAVTAGRAVRASATELGALVVVQLRARTARPGGTSTPEVVVFTQTRDMVVGHPQTLPDADGLIVVLEHGEVQLLKRQPQHIHAEIQRHGAHLTLEVLAEAEIAQHLKEAEMAPGGADNVDIVGAHALLHGGGANVRLFQLLLLQEVRLKLHHARAGQQQRRVVGDKRGRRHALTALAFEIAQISFADLRGRHVFHLRSFNGPIVSDALYS